MKKLLPLLILTIVLTGCSKSYLAEREFYKAEEALKKISQADIDARGTEVYGSAIAGFETVVTKYPGTTKALESLFIIARIYEKQEKYNEARQSLKKITINFSNNRSKAAEARFKMAQLYELEEKWGEAESLYWETAEYHQLQLRGLQAPVRIIMHYAEMGYTDARDRVYKKAIAHYEKIVDQLGPIERSAQIRNYIAIAHTSVGKWKEAREEWLDLANTYSESTGAPLALIAAAEASQKNNEEQIALSLYEKYLQKYPKHNMIGQINVRLGLVYGDRAEFSKARQYYDAALKAFEDFKGNNAQASDVKLLVARSYQAEGSWSEAKKRYHEIQQFHKNTVASMQVPLLIAQYYSENGKSEKANEVLGEAIVEYDRIMKENPEASPASQLAWRLKNDAYAQRGDWSFVYEQLDEAISNAKSQEERGKILISKAMIAEGKAKDSDMALKLYQDFLKDYSGHSLTEMAKSRQEVLAQKAVA